MRKFTVRDITLAAMVAALYAVLGYFGDIFGLTYGPIQCRFAEALTVLPFVFPAAAPGLVVGCFLTNLLSLYGPFDIVFGTLATAIAAWLTMRMPRWYLAALPPILVNAVILPPMWGLGGGRHSGCRILGGLRVQRPYIYPRRSLGLLWAGDSAAVCPAQGARPAALYGGAQAGGFQRQGWLLNSAP